VDPAVTVGALGLGFALEFLIGDPEGWPHPVRAIGRLILAGERLMRRAISAPLIGGTAAGGQAVPPAPWRAQIGGALLVLMMLILTVAPVVIVRRLLHEFDSRLLLFFDGFILYLSLALNQLIREGRQLARLISRGDLTAARENLARLVSRRTDQLDVEGISRGAVETMAENFSDGVIAPLFYFLLLGPGGAVAYKTINTLDSMIGYRDERYREFGRAAARLDDLVNWIPARVAGLLMVLAAPLAGHSAPRALAIWRRDGANHESPNAGIGKAVVAGALGLRLGGPALYADGLRDRPFIGDVANLLDARSIRATARLLLAASFLGAALALLGVSAWPR
jgi:adenosylcobinamide-phosphate synthase